jgi:hypothetical protein
MPEVALFLLTHWIGRFVVDSITTGFDGAMVKRVWKHLLTIESIEVYDSENVLERPEQNQLPGTLREVLAAGLKRYQAEYPLPGDGDIRGIVIVSRSLGLRLPLDVRPDNRRRECFIAALMEPTPLDAVAPRLTFAPWGLSEEQAGKSRSAFLSSMIDASERLDGYFVAEEHDHFIFKHIFERGAHRTMFFEIEV